jgi:hypothetical protein
VGRHRPVPRPRPRRPDRRRAAGGRLRRPRRADPAADADRLAEPHAASGVRLLPPFDPYLDQRDRATLFPDPELRARARSGIGAPGAVLVDGALAGLWRPAKKGKRLVVTVEPIAKLTRKAVDALAAEAEVIAPYRGCERAEVVIS